VRRVGMGYERVSETTSDPFTRIVYTSDPFMYASGVTTCLSQLRHCLSVELRQRDGAVGAASDFLQDGCELLTWAAPAARHTHNTVKGLRTM